MSCLLQEEGGSKSTSKCEQRDGESPKGTDSAKEVINTVILKIFYANEAIKTVLLTIMHSSSV